MPTTDLAPFHLAYKNGYFKDEGLDVEFQNAPSGQASLAKLIGGDVDIAYSSWTPFFVAQSKGAADLKIVADSSSAGPNSTMVVAMPASSVKTVKDLAGKKIAVTGQNTISDLLVKASMKAAGVDFAGVKWVTIAFPDTAAALARGDVDAAFLTEPFLTGALKQGAAPIVDAAQGPTADLPTAGYAALKKFTDVNPKPVRAFQRAMKRATDEALKDRAKVDPLIVEFAKVDPAVAKECRLLTFRSTVDAKQLQRVPDLMQEFGLITAKLDVSTMVV